MDLQDVALIVVPVLTFFVGVIINIATWPSVFERAERHARNVAERERCEQLFLAFADEHFGWKIKDPTDAESIADTLRDLRTGTSVRTRRVYVESDPDARGLPSIRYEDRFQEGGLAQAITSPSTTSSATDDDGVKVGVVLSLGEDR